MIVRFLVNFCWFFFKWSLICGLAAAIGLGGYLYVRIDDQIARHVHHILANHYRGLNVHVEGAHLLEGRGIEIRGISLAEPRLDGQEDQLLYIDQLLLVCDPQLKQLVTGDLKVEKIVVQRPVLQAIRRPGENWNVARLLPMPKLSDRSPKTRIEDARLELVDGSPGSSQPLVLSGIELELSKEQVAQAGRWHQVAKFNGSFRAKHVERMTVAGQINLATQRWQLNGSVADLRVCRELLFMLPAPLTPELAPLANLSAQVAGQFSLRGQGSDPTTLEVELDSHWTGGTFHDPRLPELLTDLHARVRVQNQQLTIENLNGRLGRTRIQLGCQGQQEDGRRTFAVSGQVRKLVLDQDLYRSLSPGQRALWQKFLPAGEVDVELSLFYDGVRWRPDCTVRCENVDFSYHKFPYPMRSAQGTIRWQGNQLEAKLTAMADSQPVDIQIDLLNPGPRGTGHIEVRGKDLTLTPAIVGALPEKGRQVLTALAAKGNFQLYWRGWKHDPLAKKMQSHLLLSVSEGEVRFERFPYPIENIRGTVEMRDGHWSFRDLEGTNDSGFITCQGRLTPQAAGTELALSFAAAGVQLEEELRDALKPSTQRLWNDLHPRGRIDVTAELRSRFPARALDLEVRVEPVGDTVSIEPEPFPYRMEKLRGVATYRNGKVRFDRLHAEHGHTRIASGGNAGTHADGRWYLELDGLTVERIHADRDFLVALPADLRKVIGTLNPTGPISMRGSFGLAGGPYTHSPVRSRWDLAFNLYRSSINCGIQLENVHGEVRLAGLFDGQQVAADGELAIDSLMYDDIQFTQVMGPFRIDKQRVLLGAWAEQTSTNQRAPRRITGKLYDGALVGDGWVVLEKTPRFALGARLTNANLERFARESLPGNNQLRGKVLGSVQLQGRGSGLHALRGSGEIRLRNADIYELPLMVSMLKVLRVRSPDSTAFTKSDMQFRIAGPHLYFDQLDFLGDAVSLYGKGEMDFNRVVKLTFHSTVGQNNLPLPTWRKLVGEASQQIMQININGPLNNPQITNEAFPVVNEALQRLQADLQQATQPGGTTPQTN